MSTIDDLRLVEVAVKAILDFMWVVLLNKNQLQNIPDIRADLFVLWDNCIQHIHTVRRSPDHHYLEMTEYGVLQSVHNNVVAACEQMECVLVAGTLNIEQCHTSLKKAHDAIVSLCVTVADRENDFILPTPQTWSP